jgi:hypothetical protein
MAPSAWVHKAVAWEEVRYDPVPAEVQRALVQGVEKKEETDAARSPSGEMESADFAMEEIAIELHRGGVWAPRMAMAMCG